MFEKLLEILAALVTALNANTEALKGSAAQPAKEKKPKPERAEIPPGANPVPQPSAAPVEVVKAPDAKVEVVAPAPTLDELRTAATTLKDFDLQNNHADDSFTVKLFKSINAKYGSERISAVPETAYGDVIAILKQGLKDLTAKIEKSKSSAI